MQRTSFIGREAEIAQIGGLLSTSPLVTVTGAGGAGKSRLAVEVARSVADAFPDGSCFIELSGLSEPALVGATIAAALGLGRSEHDSNEDAFIGFIAAKSLLLVLDNCEHLLDATADVVDQILESSETARVLATSRVPLGVQGEIIVRVPPLRTPDPQAPPVSILETEAARLFVARATAIDRTFTPSPEDTRAIAEICRRLDGMPLAIEFAAARAAVLAPAQIAAQLDEPFRLLTTGGGRASARHRTLRATLDWSHRLLGERERVLFRRLAAFVDTFELADAEAVCGVEPIDPSDVLDLITTLVDASLVGVVRTVTGARYRLLETTRDYAADQLEACGETTSIGDRHADHFCAYERLPSRDDAAAFTARAEALEAGMGNLRSALDWLLVTDPTRALEVITFLNDFWWLRGHWAEGISWLENALARAIDPPPRARHQAMMALVNGYQHARDRRLVDLVPRWLTSAREAGDDQAAADALHWVAILAPTIEEAREATEESVRLKRKVGNHSAAEGGERMLAWIARAEDGPARAEELMRASVDRARALESEGALADALVDLAEFLRQEQRLDEVQETFREGVAITGSRDPWRLYPMLGGLANVAVIRSDLEQARDVVARTLEVARRFGRDYRLVWTLGQAAAVARALGDLESAAAYMHEALAMSEGMTDPLLIGGMRTQLARAARDLGDLETARKHIEAAPPAFAALRAWYRAAGARIEAARIEAAGGDLDAAAGMASAIVTEAERESWHGEHVMALWCLAGIEAARGDAARAASLAGAAEAIRERENVLLGLDNEVDVERDRTAVRAATGDAYEGMLERGKVALTRATEQTRPACTIVLEGDVCAVAFDDEVIRIRSSKGLRYLRVLLDAPGREVHALDLVTPGSGADAASLEDRSSVVDAFGDAGEVLDRRARDAYRRRLLDLQEEIDEAEGFGDAERASRAREEMGFVTRELSSGIGLGGRSRRAASVAERARVNVTRAIRSAIARIGEQNPALAAHLDRAVHTGTFCVYDPAR